MAILSFLPFVKSCRSRGYHKLVDHHQQGSNETKRRSGNSIGVYGPKRDADLAKEFAKKRLHNELRIMGDEYVSHCSFGLVNEQDPFQLQAVIIGPSDTPFQDGIFFLTINIPHDYPFKPPQIKFETKVFHPNVASDGTIQIDILSTNWSPALCIQKLLLSICSFLPEPNHEQDGCNAVCDLYWNHRKRYEVIAKEWTRKYAMI